MDRNQAIDDLVQTGDLIKALNAFVETHPHAKTDWSATRSAIIELTQYANQIGDDLLGRDKLREIS